MPPRKATTTKKATTTRATRKVRATRSFRPSAPELEYVIIEGAVVPDDHPAVVANPEHFTPADK